MKLPKLLLCVVALGIVGAMHAESETYAVFVGINEFVNPGFDGSSSRRTTPA